MSNAWNRTCFKPHFFFPCWFLLGWHLPSFSLPVLALIANSCLGIAHVSVRTRLEGHFEWSKLNLNNRLKQCFQVPQCLPPPCVQNTLRYSTAHWQISKVNKMAIPNWWASSGSLPKTQVTTRCPNASESHEKRKHQHDAVYWSSARSNFTADHRDACTNECSGKEGKWKQDNKVGDVAKPLHHYFQWL